MNSNPLISVIIVTYNAGEKLKSTVLSALDQSYKNIEILIKDGDSNDNSVDNLLKEIKDNRVRCYIEKDKGIYDAMNRAVSLMSGDYCIFINSGDTFHDKDSLSNAIKYMEVDGFEHDIYYGNNFTVNRNSVTYSPKKMSNWVCFNSVIGHQTMMYSAHVFDSIKFDVSKPICACITHYIIAFKRFNMSFLYIPVIISNYEGGGVSDSAKGRKSSILGVRECLKDEFGIVYYWYAFLSFITLKRMKEWLSMQDWFEDYYRKLTILFKGNRK